MARGVNKVILLGNLGNDPEVKYTQGGMAICSISLATTDVRKDKDGNKVESTQWHRVKFFGKLGEIAGEYLKKGRQVYVEGSIRYSKFTNREGVEQYATEIVGEEMQMLGSDPGREGGQAPRPSREQQHPRRPNPARDTAPMDDFSDDDIPF